MHHIHRLFHPFMLSFAMAYEDRKRADRERQERKRLRDDMERLASTRAIDQALVHGIRKVVADCYGGSFELAAHSRNDLAFILKFAIEHLRRRDYDIDSEVQRARLLTRIGDDSMRGYVVRGPDDAL